MKLIFTVYILYFIAATTVEAQVGIGTDIPEGALDIVSTTGGLVPPRMTEAQRDALAQDMCPTGSVIYNITKNCIQTNEGTSANPAWKCLQMFTPASGSEIVKLFYSKPEADPNETLSIDNLVFRFPKGVPTSTRSPNSTAPEMALKTNPGTNVEIYVTAIQQIPNLYVQSYSSIKFTREDFFKFKKIVASDDNIAIGEVNIFYFTNPINNRYYMVKFHVSDGIDKNKNFTIIVEKF